MHYLSSRVVVASDRLIRDSIFSSKFILPAYIIRLRFYRTKICPTTKIAISLLCCRKYVDFSNAVPLLSTFGILKHNWCFAVYPTVKREPQFPRGKWSSRKQILHSIPRVLLSRYVIRFYNMPISMDMLPTFSKAYKRAWHHSFSRSSVWAIFRKMFDLRPFSFLKYSRIIII